MDRLTRQFSQLEISPSPKECENYINQISKNMSFEIRKLRYELEMQKRENSWLADEIRKCNKEVSKQRRALRKKPSLLRETLLRESLKRLSKK